MHSYTIAVTAQKPNHPGGDFLNDNSDLSGLGDFVGARIVIDGVPYRQSGSHASPAGATERSTAVLRGMLVHAVSGGNHTVKVQWRRWGSFVRAWSSNPTFDDGFASGRSLTVTADHRGVWFTQPVTSARISKRDEWQSVRDTAVTFTTHAKRTHRIMYVMHFRPEQAPNTDVYAVRDALAARLVVDGVPYRESASAFHTVSATHSSGSLVGLLVLELEAGDHSVRLQWRKQGTGVAAWYAQPDMLDGFVSARGITVTTEQFAVVHQELLSGARAPDASPPGPQHEQWHDVRDGALDFTLHTPSSVQFSYTLNLRRYGAPTHDSWTWDRWGTAATRLVIDGSPYIHTSASFDGSVQAQGVLSGDTTARLVAGTHSVRVQWRLYGASPDSWASFRDIVNGCVRCQWAGGLCLISCLICLC